MHAFLKSAALGMALTVLMLSLPSALATAAAQRVSDIDRIVVVVNDDVITESELIQRLRETRKQLEMEKISAPPDAALRKQLLERMVLERLQLQLAAQSGIRISESDVDRAFETVALRNKLGVEEFRKVLAQKGMDVAAYRNQLRDQMTIQQLLEREISNRITVTDNEVENFLENPQSRADMDVTYQLSHILIGIPEAASPEAIQAARKRAEDIHRQLAGGANFEQTAVSQSQGADALKGGNLGWKKAGELPELFLATIKNMAVGSVSEILRSPNGFHILKLNGKRGGDQAEAVTQTHVRHILLKPSEIQSLDDARQKLSGLRERIENGEDFAALARAHSDDTGSAANGGDLGWANPGQMVPEFEKAMNALQPNQLSQPVKTPFGLHLIQVLGRRSHDVTQEREFAAARQQIHARKADERYEQWARQLRNEAFVEYLLEEVN
ncbi:molecular chaperone SurA [Sulfuricaulis limicola]|uniref:Chaperone SurA n=1 Tax=Sulfuricaulis limicola TaxID=1620215 RepID=A0A1B4XJ45_9GAMM|nr:peptidylprolyl isomerase [Sulfuricaulis limicola]BAV34811.1 molecular chaperone SurA [Sulfuricaulis limicola]